MTISDDSSDTESSTINGVVSHCGPCPYLPHHEFHAFQPVAAEQAAPAYRLLMDHRFRRSGGTFYMPTCPSCDACKPVRVDVAAFQPRADQRRCERRNHDLVVTWHPRGLDDERRSLYLRYEQIIHQHVPESDPAIFLVGDGGVVGGELHARDKDGRLMAVSVCDRFDDALSSVYCYWEPEAAQRGLGTFMALAELAFARAQGLRWLYLGFLVEECSKMSYKSRFTPQEVLIGERWERRETSIAHRTS